MRCCDNGERYFRKSENIRYHAPVRISTLKADASHNFGLVLHGGSP